MTVKRTRPGARNRPDRTDKALPPLNSPFPGCCKPYPYAVFVDQKLVELTARHTGRHCKGYQEPMSLEEWNADADARSAARRRDGGDDR
jgi:hypothetical protein